MSRRSYTIRTRVSTEDNFAIEPPFNALAGHPYYIAPAALAVYNKPGSGKAVYIETMNVKPLTTGENAANILQLQKITAASGGDVIAAQSLDSGNASLPSQVECRLFPVSATVTGSSVLRRTMLQSKLHFTATLASFVARTTGDSRSGNDSGEFYNHTTDADAQAIVLRAGEGVVLTNVNDHSHMGYAVSLMVKDVTNALTYRFNTLVDPIGDTASHVLSLLNGAGSGIVLEIHRIQIRETGTYETPLATWERIESLDDSVEAALPTCIQPHDSSLPLDANILVRANATATKAGFKSGGLISIPMFHRAQLLEPPFGAGVAGVQLGRRGKFSKDLVNNGEGNLVLREGEGVGLYLRNASGLFVHEAQICFTVADVVPAVGDVRSGTAYGFSQELTGTLVAGGGGGNTYSRGRVVNG